MEETTARVSKMRGEEGETRGNTEAEAKKKKVEVRDGSDRGGGGFVQEEGSIERWKPERNLEVSARLINPGAVCRK